MTREVDLVKPEVTYRITFDVIGGKEVEIQGIQRISGKGSVSIPEVMERCFAEIGV